MSASARWPALVIAALAVIAISLGLVVTGGPGQGRREQRDAVRQTDLARIVAQVDCLTRQAGGEMPGAVVTTRECPDDPRLTDPFTEQPYRYEITGERSYRLCAGFEVELDARAVRHPFGLVVADGCLHHALPPVE